MTIRSRPATDEYRVGYDRVFAIRETYRPPPAEPTVEIAVGDEGGWRSTAKGARDGPLAWDGCEAALVGVLDCIDGVKRCVYERNALVEVFMNGGMEEDEAEEWVSFNIEGAYIGAATPLIVDWRWATSPITRPA